MKVIAVFMHIERGMGAETKFLGIARNASGVYKICKEYQIKDNRSLQFIEDCLIIEEHEVRE